MSPSDLARAALDYPERLGFAVFPCKPRDKTPLATHGCKSATVDPVRIRAWWERHPEANVAIATGDRSGIVVLDVDPRHGGDKSLTELQLKYGPLPDAPRVWTGGGGSHIYFAHPGRAVRNSAGKIGSGLDIRGDGGYVVAPPSIHSSGEIYRWDPDLRIGQLALPQVPEWFLELVVNDVRCARSAAEAHQEIGAGSRNNELYKLARSLHARKLRENEILASLRAVNCERCRPPLPDDEVVKIASNAATQPDSPDFKRQADPEILKLAALSRMEYDRVRKSQAKRLGIRIQTLDAEVEKFRQMSGPASEHEKLVPPPPEPWPEPVAGLALLDELRAYLTRFVVVSEDAKTTLALWIVFSYLLDIAEVSPRLAILSPTKRCGKSTVLGLLMALVRCPASASNISGSAVFRTIDAVHPTLLIDEADTFTRDNHELKGILNSGHMPRTAYVLRSIKVGDDWTTKNFSTWGAIAFACIGKLPDTWMDRSLVIAMNRKPSMRTVERLWRRNTAARTEAAEFSRKIARWAADHREQLRAAEPEMPKSLDDRACDNWEILLAIADSVGGAWPASARRTAVALSSNREDAASIRELLLGDVRRIFEASDRKTDRLSSASICAELGAMETRPWPEFGKARKPISQNQLARLLAPFGVMPRSIRSGTETAKGYLLSDFADAFSRYTSAQTATPSHAQAELDSVVSQSVTGKPACVGRKCE